VGLVRMYGEDVSIDKRTRSGYDLVLKKIEPLICDWARKVYFGNMPYEDRKQEIYMIAIQGVDNFNPDKGVALSSFLHTHIRNKILSKMRTSNKKSRNATTSTADCSGYLEEIPLSRMSVEGEDVLSYISGTSDTTSDVDASFLLREMKERFSEKEFSIIKMRSEGASIKEVGEALDIKPHKVSLILKKIKESPFSKKLYLKDYER
jgi:RNA polymerase sigma factor (sigma-70 family)